MAKRKRKQQSNFLVSTLAALGVLLLLVVVFAGYFSLQTPLCEDTCSASSCVGAERVACVEQANGCLAEEPQGVVLGQCGVACVVDADCGADEMCGNDYQCYAEYLADMPVADSFPDLDITSDVFLQQRAAHQCGNGVADVGETCGTCPEDAGCDEGYACRFGSCEFIGLTSTTGVVYCGYNRGSYREEDYSGNAVSDHAVSSYATCGNPDALIDQRYAMSNTRWTCYDVDFPQYASVELAEETIVNRLRLLASHMGNNDFTVSGLRVYFSADSTDGVNGHWMLVADNLAMGQGYKEPLDIFTDPISTKWVRVEVLGTRGETGDRFALGELIVYEAPYVCTGNYEDN